MITKRISAKHNIPLSKLHAYIERESPLQPMLPLNKVLIIRI